MDKQSIAFLIRIGSRNAVLQSKNRSPGKWACTFKSELAVSEICEGSDWRRLSQRKNQSGNPRAGDGQQGRNDSRNGEITFFPAKKNTGTLDLTHPLRKPKKLQGGRT